MNRFLKTVCTVACLVALAGCQTTTTTRTIAVDPTARVGEAPVQVSRAIATFEAVCGASLPNFDGAARLMTQNGVTNRAATGTVFNPTENLSFRIIDGPGSGRTCSMAFATTESRRTVFNAYTQAFGEIRPSPFGQTAVYRGRPALMIFGEARRVGNLNYFGIQLLSERS